MLSCGSRPRAVIALIASLAALAVLSPQALADGNVNWGAGVQAQLPADAGTSGQLGLVNAISCPAAGNCTAVGQYNDAFGQAQGLLLTQTSDLWGTGVGASLPPDASAGPGVALQSVSCRSAGNCTAVGDYYGSAGGTEGLLLTETAGTWENGVQALLPSDAGPVANVVLTSVSCSSSGNCTAVGRYTDGANSTQGLLLTQVNGTWTPPVEAPLPNNVSASPGVSLDAVSCASAGNCTAVGNFNDSSGAVEGLLLTETAGSWATGVRAPLPNDSNARPVVRVQSVSCASPGDCTAVGDYLDGSGNNQGLLLTQSSGTWANGVRAPLPGNASQSPIVVLSSVACSSAGDCTAVGTYSGGSTGQHGLLLTQTGGGWASAVQAPLPGNASSSSNVSLPSVSCSSAGNCSAVGQYQDSSGNVEGLLLTESGSAWATGVEAALPAGSASNPQTVLNSVSCDSAGSCSTVGYYEDSSTNFQGVIISASPSTPTLSVSSPAAAIVGGTITASSLAANLAGGADPTGTITFTVFGPQASPPSSCASGGTTVGTASLAGNGSYNPSSDFTPPMTGTYWWYASYGGDPGNSPIVSMCGSGMPSTLVRQATTTLTAGAPSARATGSAIPPSQLSATISGGTSGVSGTITLTVFGPQPTAPTSCTSGGTTVGARTVSGNGTYSPITGFTPAAPGTYWWYASYGGDSNDAPSASTCGHGMASTDVTNTTTLDGSGPATGTVGTPIDASSLAGSLSGAFTGAGGTITFTVFGPQTSAPSTCTGGGTTVGTATVSGNGTYSPSAGFTPAAGGTYWWYASYGGDSSNAPSGSACGTGMASTVVSKLATGVSAAAPATGTVSSPIAANSISSVLSGAASGAGGTITFTIFGPQATAPSSCSSGGTTVDTVPVSGNATYNPTVPFSPSAGGTYWWYASYTGDAGSTASHSTCGAGMASTVVSKLATAVSAAAPSTGTAGTPIPTSSVSSVLSGATNTAAGTITFTVFGPQSSPPTSCATGGTTVGTAPVSGDSTYNPSASFTATAAGTYWWYASYGGDAGNTASGSTCGAGMGSTVISKLTTAVSAAAPSTGSAGTPIPTSSVSSVLSGATTTAGGTITFTVFGPQSTPPTSCTTGGRTVGTAGVSGDKSYNPSAAFTATTAGKYWWYASYGGDAGNTPAASPCGATMPNTTVVLPRPVLSKLKQTQTRWQAGTKPATIFESKRSASRTPIGTTFTFTLNEAAKVTLVFTHLVRGHIVAAGTLSLAGHAGNDRIVFQGQLSRTHKLAPGSYTVTFTATNTARQSSSPQKLSFTIVS